MTQGNKQGGCSGCLGTGIVIFLLIGGVKCLFEAVQVGNLLSDVGIVGLVMLGLDAIIILVWKKRRSGRINAFINQVHASQNRYVDLIQNQHHTSVDNIAFILHRREDVDSVMREIQVLIDNGTLAGFTLDATGRQVRRIPTWPAAPTPRQAPPPRRAPAPPPPPVVAPPPVGTREPEKPPAEPARPSVFVCKACGASNAVTSKTGPAICRYCGTPADI